GSAGDVGNEASVMSRCGFRRAVVAAALFTLTTAAHGDDKVVPPGSVEMVPPPGDGAKYWPRWRGPSGQGVVEPGGYPDRWSDTDNVLWKVDLPGRGNSSPIIWNDRLFLTTSFDNGRRRAVLCLD